MTRFPHVMYRNDLEPNTETELFASEADILWIALNAIINYKQIRAFLKRVPGPF